MEYTKDEIRHKLGTDHRWTERALLALLALQTADEQQDGTTRYQNAQGFNALDANILTSFAQQVQRGRQLSVKQLAIAYRLLPKYAGQLHRIAKQKGDSNG